MSFWSVVHYYTNSEGETSISETVIQETIETNTPLLAMHKAHEAKPIYLKNNTTGIEVVKLSIHPMSQDPAKKNKISHETAFVNGEWN